MPYEKIEDLPDNVKGVLPTAAQHVWMNVFNANFEKAGEDEARKVAWGAVKLHWQSAEGTWVRKNSFDTSKCMCGCGEPPTVEVIWADGRATAWFSDACFDEWKAREIKVGETTHTYADEIVKQRVIDGVAGGPWDEAEPQKEPVDSVVDEKKDDTTKKLTDVHVHLGDEPDPSVTALQKKFQENRVKITEELLKQLKGE